MRNPSSNVDIGDLLVHADWVRHLARGLVANAAQADDVVQDTWVAALERPPVQATNLRGWLARVVRNVARQRGRSEARRERREVATARGEATSSTAELADRAALQRDVVGHVLTLDEPFRAVVLLRFFEGLPPRAIADRLGVPVKTVNSRLQRAFAKLHEKLDREYGDRAAWCAALVPLCVGSDAVAATSGSLWPELGGWIVKTNTKVGLALAASVLGGLGLWRVLPEGSGASTARPTTPEVEPDVPVAAAALDREPERVRIAESAPATVAAPTETAAAGSPATVLYRVRGRAVDVRGNPHGGVEIATDDRPNDALATTASDGTFVAEIEQRDDRWASQHPDRICLRVVDPHLVTLWESCVRETNVAQEHIVVAATVTAIEGSVVDAGLAPIEGAQVSLTARDPMTFALHGSSVADVFPYPLDMTSAVEFALVTDAAGRFRFGRFPQAPGQRLFVSADGFEAAFVDLDSAAEPLVVQLTRAEDADGRFVDGIVIDERGAPVAGATVQLANDQAQSRTDGTFRIAADWVEPATPLCAAKKGRLPALVPNFGEVLGAGSADFGPVELVLGGAPLDIRGRVLDADGRPCAGWSVSILDETEISQLRIPIATAEGLARKEDGVARTDSDGGFHLTGLFARDYRLQAWDEDSLLRTEGVVAAGSQSAVLRASNATRGDVRGVVVNRHGAPLADVEVRLCLDTVKGSVGSSHISGETQITDDSGAFAFDAVPRDYVYLRLRGESILPLAFVLPADESAEGHEIVAFRRCHFRIEPSDPSNPAERVTFLDADGQSLQVNRFQANGMSAYPWALLNDGRSEVLSVSEQATTAAVFRDEVEIARHPVVLDPVGVNVLRF